MSNTLSEPLVSLVRRWQRGWALASTLPPAEEADGALHVCLGLPDRRVERIVLDADRYPQRVLDMARRVAASSEPDWLTVPTNDPDHIVGLLSRAGLEADPARETLMSVDLTGHPGPAPCTPYSAHLAEEDVPPGRERVLRAHLSAPGTARACGGIGAVADTDMVAHAIRTEPGHRRRGLGSVVMGVLAARAREHGAKEGLLISTPQGRGLYASLGWRARADVVVARSVVG
ncbi:GNAT family N-acetyltransferase [Nocardiopsis sp. L17-MgMaSL7]|uniref:GNAT family N-acetyltransferase n=1 Tax=Nocardiopsis sp. L17-MgMaSL7 TaxID=1938893 RepID=UPI000D71A858|nr:GNAT family N-acetyltransferase [Nocardiopsis sp. L17-MgMaSL7]PWV46829.1 acetyltransferase (GNAT) family protein [Nocardiopsis sp. L17-MgMaSL7]